MLRFIYECIFGFKRLAPPVEADPPPWDVPLDQTTAPLHELGDRYSV